MLFANLLPNFTTFYHILPLPTNLLPHFYHLPTNFYHIFTSANLLPHFRYVKNPAFRPENVQDLSISASKLCDWMLSVVQAGRLLCELRHERIDYDVFNFDEQIANISQDAQKMFFLEKMIKRVGNN